MYLLTCVIYNCNTLNLLIFLMKVKAIWLELRDGLMILLFDNLPEDGILVPKHAGVVT